MLYQLGHVQFDVAPVNLHQVDHEVGADFVFKEVFGAKKPGEFVGEADETLTLTGRLFPHRHAGAQAGFEALQDMARAGEPQMLMRGDGAALGFMAIKKVKGGATYLDGSGVGRVLEFSIELQAADNGPSVDALESALGALTSLFG